jgi:hypothetical protein
MQFRAITVTCALTLLTLLGAAPHASAQTTILTSEAAAIATEAYVYGYSLITTDVTRVQMSNVNAPETLRGPMNTFVNVPRYPPADYRGVSAPNADTLYSLAWLDLATAPGVQPSGHGQQVSPVSHGRSVDDDLCEPGQPHGRRQGRRVSAHGPGWKGKVPKGMTHIPAATRYVVILGRTYADGTEKDYQAVNALQAQYKITPLSAWGKPFAYKAPPVEADPGFSMTDKPQQVILRLGTDGYFNMMAKLMCKDSPAAAADAPLLAKMAKIGIEPCKPFTLGKLDPAAQQALRNPRRMRCRRSVRAGTKAWANWSTIGSSRRASASTAPTIRSERW